MATPRTPWPPACPHGGQRPVVQLVSDPDVGTQRYCAGHAAIAAEHFRPLVWTRSKDQGWQRGYLAAMFPTSVPTGLMWLSEQPPLPLRMKLGLWIAPTNVACTSQLFRDNPNGDKDSMAGRARRAVVLGAGSGHDPPRRRPSRRGEWIEEDVRPTFVRGASYYKIDFIAARRPCGRAMRRFVAAPGRTHGSAIARRALAVGAWPAATTSASDTGDAAWRTGFESS